MRKLPHHPADGSPKRNRSEKHWMSLRVGATVVEMHGIAMGKEDLPPFRCFRVGHPDSMGQTAEVDARNLDRIVLSVAPWALPTLPTVWLSKLIGCRPIAKSRSATAKQLPLASSTMTSPGRARFFKIVSNRRRSACPRTIPFGHGAPPPRTPPRSARYMRS